LADHNLIGILGLVVLSARQVETPTLPGNAAAAAPESAQIHATSRID
jgi:hypothetical protein